MTENRDSPICKALEGRGAPDPDAPAARIPEKVANTTKNLPTLNMLSVQDLPRCQKPSCGGLLRPHVVWFGERLDEKVLPLGISAPFVAIFKLPWFLDKNPPKVLDAAEDLLEKCDLCLVVGTSSVVYPAAMFAPQVSKILTGGSKNEPLILRLQQGEFQWQNSTWRQLLPLRDLEDMVFSSKYKLQLYFHIFTLRYFSGTLWNNSTSSTCPLSLKAMINFVLCVIYATFSDDLRHAF